MAPRNAPIISVGFLSGRKKEPCQRGRLSLSLSALLIHKIVQRTNRPSMKVSFISNRIPTSLSGNNRELNIITKTRASSYTQQTGPRFGFSLFLLSSSPGFIYLVNRTCLISVTFCCVACSPPMSHLQPINHHVLQTFILFAELLAPCFVRTNFTSSLCRERDLQGSRELSQSTRCTYNSGVKLSFSKKIFTTLSFVDHRNELCFQQTNC